MNPLERKNILLQGLEEAKLLMSEELANIEALEPTEYKIFCTLSSLVEICTLLLEEK